VYGGEEVILAMVEDVVADGDAGGDEFGDAALDEFLCQLGVFELFADGDAFAGADEFWQIGVECVMGESRRALRIATRRWRAVSG